MSNITIEPDPYDPEAVAIAEELMSRPQLGRVRRVLVSGTPQVATIARYAGLIDATDGLTADERVWLTTYKVAARRKTRADAEAARVARRARR